MYSLHANTVQKQLTKFVDQKLHFGDQVALNCVAGRESLLSCSAFFWQVDMGNSVFTIELGPLEENPFQAEA
jgi:hypothetical protein